ncbi:MAG: 5-(carboxyamino)imidazole ribonucleotide synthase [Sphingomonadales bacterium]
MQKVGILGGGQLGRMLLQAAEPYSVETHVLENDPECPAAPLCDYFTLGDIRNFDDVYAFGRSLDSITIEIEQVNIDALEKLAAEGVVVIPEPRVLRLIKNKIAQKAYYLEQHIPTADFVITQTRNELLEHISFLPAVHKIGEGGYDGKGVQVIKDASELSKGFDAPAVLERMVPIKKELAVMVAINQNRETAVYPLVEMCFDPTLNLLDYQLCPAQVNASIASRATQIALQVVQGFRSPGLFAVEMFLDQQDRLLVNETAPRVHNSGHHSIEAIDSSQFDMMWRILLSMPIGSTRLRSPSVMINLVGSGVAGPAQYHGMAQVSGTPGLSVHLYEKKTSKPGRKMGHMTLLGSDVQHLKEQARELKKALSVSGGSER